MLKDLIQGYLGSFGLRLSRIHDPDAILDPAVRSIAKGASPHQHNSRENMDVIYADPNLLTHYFTKQRLAFYQQVSERLIRLKLQPADILDVGCGSGHLLMEAKKLFPAARLQGVDFSPEANRLARQISPGLSFDILSIFELEKLGRQFDLVLCTEVLEHLEEADRAMKKLLAISHPGATLVITVPQGRKDTFAGHFNFWTRESFRREFQALKPAIEEFGDYLFIVISKPEIT